MRGLKRSFETPPELGKRSHLLQMRGLKLTKVCQCTRDAKVASFTDAWIETDKILGQIHFDWSHLLQMRGLKPNRNLYYKNYLQSHLLQMRGLKLKVVLCPSQVWASHLLQMRGLKPITPPRNTTLCVASFTDAWIETLKDLRV